ncbi:malonyl-CoA decarboxylase [Neoconidiobolus thromboides FSU 785]|nr:malonyl-CoA decarboxylase [Neoconidiobolus thromboides FSU 785]
MQPKEGDLLPGFYTKESCKLYKLMKTTEKKKFIQLLIQDFDIDNQTLLNDIREYIKLDLDSNELRKRQQILRQDLTPKYNQFFDHVLQLPNGLRFLIDMREDVIEFLKLEKDQNLVHFNQELKLKLQSNLLNFLNLERISWNSSASTLEKVISYERVHPFTDWNDLKQRVGPGRRCFGFFHKAMANDPLVYIQVALVKEISNNVQSILNDKPYEDPSPENIESAIFYSINSQIGLSGVDLGSFLIKRVVKELKVEFPMLKNFCTLSPLPSFRTWVIRNLAEKNSLLPNEIKNLKNYSSNGDAYQVLNTLVSTHEWVRYPERVDLLEPILMRLALNYILQSKRGIHAVGKVANFHLRNGACVHRINWLANTSEKGLNESFGIMINYNYILKYIEENNRIYLKNGTIPISGNKDDIYFKEYFEHQQYPYLFRNISSKL